MANKAVSLETALFLELQSDGQLNILLIVEEMKKL